MRKQGYCSIVIALIAVLACVRTTSAQTYESLWRETAELRGKDLPKSALQKVDKIILRASRKGDGGQLLKACLMRAQLARDVAPDSAEVVTGRMEALLGREKRPEMQALYHAVLARLYAAKDRQLYEEAPAKAVAHFMASMVQPEVLAKARATDYVPLMVTGADSRFYGQDLLSVVAKWSAGGLAGMGDTVLRTDSLGRSLFHRALDTYRAARNREAELLMMMDSADAAGTTFRPLMRLGKRRTVNKENDGKEAFYQSLTKRFGDLDACVEAYIRLAATSDKKKAYAWATEGLRRYGGKGRGGVLRNVISGLTAPTLSLTLSRSLAYPGEEDTLRVAAVRMKNAVVRFYAVSHAADDEALLRASQEDYGRWVVKALREVAVTLPEGEPYETVKANVPVGPMAAGIYLVQVAGSGVKSNLELYYVSRLRVMQLGTEGGKMRVVTVDGRSGHPLPGVTIALRDQAQNGRIVRRVTTGADGTTELSRQGSYQIRLFPRLGDDAFCPGVQLESSYDYAWERKDRSRQAVLYTDRAIYRPGQKVNVGGFLYDKSGDEVHAVADTLMQLRLQDANGKELKKLGVRTDALGSVGAVFSLPQSCLNGYFSIVSEWGRASFRVEEYKRPTFQVTFDPVTMGYEAGDSITLHGTVKTYAGFPLPATRVSVKTTRRYAPWFFFGYNEAETCQEDTVVTDDEGRFSVPVLLQTPAEAPNAGGWVRPSFHLFATEAVATAADGETETAECNLFVGNRPLWLETTLGTRICREEKGTFVVRQRNAGGTLVEGRGHYSVTRGERVVKEGVIDFNHPIDRTLFSSLPSGEYRLTVLPEGRRDSLVMSQQTFALFSLKDRRPVGSKALQVYQSATTFGDMTPVTVQVGTPLKDVCLYYNAFAGGKEIEKREIHLSDSVTTLSFRWRPEYGNGLRAIFAFMRNGEIYTEALNITKPEPDKQLTLRWSAFRDRLRPGQKEEWRLQVLRHGQPVRASVMATLYDGSLERLAPLRWPFSLYFDRFIPALGWAYEAGGGLMLEMAVEQHYQEVADLAFTHIDESLFDVYRRNFYRSAGLGRLRMSKVALASANMKMDAVALNAMPDASQEIESGRAASDVKTKAEPTLRTDFSETAYFAPSLTTDEQGEAVLSFTLPQSLTEWDCKVLAHTKDLCYGTTDTTAVARKDFMVQPNMPRFLRVGDRTQMDASVRNASQEAVAGQVVFTMTDPATGQVVNRQTAPFRVEAGREQVVSFPVTVTPDYPLLVCRIVAQSANFSDGEQHYLPILADQQEITESLPLTITSQGKQKVDLSGLFEHNNPSATHRRLTVEYTGNPAWMALEALPSLARPESDNAISLVTAYYALSLARMEARENPVIEQLARKWKTSGRVDSVYLMMERNEDLKQVILQETPWVAEADGERERCLHLAELFDSVTLSYRTQTYLDKLLYLQSSDGSWSWFKGMPGWLGMTTWVVKTLARLGQLCPQAETETVTASIRRAFRYMDGEVAKEVASMKKMEKQSHSKAEIGEGLLDYLYICALRGWKSTADRDYLVARLEKSATRYDMYPKAMAACVLRAAGRDRAARLTLRSLMEHTVAREDMGRYFDTERAGWSWNSYRIPTQVAALEALDKLTPEDTTTIQDMTRWLLQAKRTETWDNARSSVDAVYYLFCKQKALQRNGGTGFPRMTLAMAGGKEMDVTPADDATPLGYYRRTLSEKELGGTPSSLDIVTGAGQQGLKATPAFGSVYAQYLIPMKEVKSAASGLSLTCQYSVRRGDVWVPVTSSITLRKGSLLRIRYTLTADRDMDMVCLKEGRPACCEPVKPLSGYDGSLGCYRDVKDASTLYFFQQLSKGRHVMETEMRMDRSGTFSSAVPVVQCVYAPEFSARSEAVVLHGE